MNPPADGICPVCGAALQTNARFCLHCMTSFDNKRAAPSAKPRGGKKRRSLLIAAAAVTVAAVAVILFLALRDRKPAAEDAASEQPSVSQEKTSVPQKEPSVPQTEPSPAEPLTDYDTFLQAVVRTAERYGCASYWDASAFLDVGYNNSTGVAKYTCPLDLQGARLSLFYRNGTEVITLILTDVPENRLYDAKRVCAAVHDAVTNRYSDVLTIITDDETYTFRTYDEPFVPFFAEMVGRADRYEAAVQAGQKMTTRMVLINDGTAERFSAYIETRRESERTLYDLVLRFDYYGDEEVEFTDS